MATITQIPNVGLANSRQILSNEFSKYLVMAGTWLDSSRQYATFRIGHASSGYQVPASKKLVIWHMFAQATNGVQAYPRLAYGDNDVGTSTSSVPTNIVYAFGVSAAFYGTTVATTIDTNFFGIPTYFEVPTTKYPCVNVGVGTSEGFIYIYCTLEDA